MFGIVWQDFARYSLSLRENIELNHGQGDYEAAQAMADVGRIAGKLPQGADSLLGKIYADGVDLSGGEWQKIAIARALYRNCPFLILDEPTASLSPLAESGIYSKFSEITQGKTVLLISHRLGSAKIAGKLFLLDDGRIGEQGSHAGLMQLNGLYAQMYRSQSSWYYDGENEICAPYC